MSAQKVMFYTKDNRIVVANVDFSGYDDNRKRLELERLKHYFLQYEFNETAVNYNNRNRKPDAEKNILMMMDPADSSFINKYISGFEYTKDRNSYKNTVEADNFPPEVKKRNTLHFDYSLAESAVPEFIKNLGFEIVPEEVTKDIDVDDPDFEENFSKQRVRMDVSPQNRRVRIFRSHYTFPPADYVRLRRLITDYESKSPKPDIDDYYSRITNGRERKLFHVYQSEIKYTLNRENFAHHEFHHVKNRMVFYGVMLKPDVKRLTAENVYRLEVENERSAYLSQTIEAINRYLKGGNFDDYSMFDNFSKGLVDKIKNLSNAEKVAYLTDMDRIVNGAVKHFESSRRDYYDEHQFGIITKSSLLTQPMDVPEDVSGEQYRLMRSAFYSISVYNPTTGRMETRNLSKYIKPENEVKITAKQQQDIIEPAKRELQTKLSEFGSDSHQSGIDSSLLDEARAMLRKSMRSPRVISEAQTINVADLAEGKLPTDEHTNNPLPPSPTPPSPTPTPAPAPAPIPDDKAGWSDDLQKYWKQFDGYNEMAKNNLEYRFAVNNQEVCYTSKNNVSLSKNCEYEMYKRLVNEPSSLKKAVRFEDTLSKEQALMLYVACVNSGRRMRGSIPQDLSMIETMTSIPQAERDKFKQKMNPQPQNSSTTRSITFVNKPSHNFGR